MVEATFPPPIETRKSNLLSLVPSEICHQPTSMDASAPLHSYSVRLCVAILMDVVFLTKYEKMDENC